MGMAAESFPKPSVFRRNIGPAASGGRVSGALYNFAMVSVVHSVAAQSDFEHSLQTLSEGLNADEAVKIRLAAQFALSVLSEEDGACARQIDSVAGRLDSLAEFDPALAEVASLIASVQAELGEAVSSLRRPS